MPDIFQLKVINDTFKKKSNPGGLARLIKEAEKFFKIKDPDTAKPVPIQEINRIRKRFGAEPIRPQNAKNEPIPKEMQTPFDDLFQDVAQRLNLDPKLLKTVAQVESNFNPEAVSPAGAQGIMQVMPAIAKVLGVENPLDPAQNIEAGARLLSEELQRFQKPELALAAYNAGSPRVLDAIERATGNRRPDPTVTFEQIQPFLPEETQQYVPKILNLLSQNQNLKSVGDLF